MNSGQHLVLVIDDEPPIRKFLRASLENAGFRVAEAGTAAEGLRLAAAAPPELVLLDLGLPDLDGQQVLVRLREWFSGPVLVLSARDQESAKILALDQGADDYVTKPFGTGELLARIRNALRHLHRTTPEAQVVSLGDLKIDLTARIVWRQGSEVHLTPLEYKLFATMVRHAGKVLTHRFLLREVWGPADSQEHHYLRIFIANLRRKLEDNPAQPRHFRTEQGVGYRLVAE